MMALEVRIYEQRDDRWHLCHRESIPHDALSSWEGWSEDLGYIERAIDFARVFRNHRIYILDTVSNQLHLWQSGVMAGCATVKSIPATQKAS